MNKRNTTAKESMLKNIRQALLVKQDHPHKDFEETPLYKDAEDSLDVTFARELTEAGGNFVYCDGEIAVIESLILLAEKLKINKIHAWEPGVQQLLQQYGFPIYTNEHHFEDTDASITACEVLVARNGSVLVSNVDLAGRRLSIYPPVHIVIAKASQLVIDIRHGLKRLSNRYGAQLPSMISLITGPSRTADIQKELVLGAHGPKELYVFLLEDRF
ncbi:LUD domain-containing protein [Sphingobacterium sp. UT-1RO-CII-1]|uniref:LutC/YkgG family protein n=1 Tax=Sphingobacterium sp. UT-1RO-CII-1 TaxID=2995225 RepID=UPI00227BA585|nr:LUD domain-containing protein [Sphingobacterium sp. UT-1RO-CII-1]MCY4780858.1 LUD domain-containing protein [Sphingobacterium sp. UT-1RO-CII-1]